MISHIEVKPLSQITEKFKVAQDPCYHDVYVFMYSPPCLFSVSDIHRKRNYGSTRSTRPITGHERTAVCKSQLEAIIENPGNTRGEGWRNKPLVAGSQTDYIGL